MHKCILKVFGMLKSSIKFLKIINVFIILMLLLYWIEHLINAEWMWMDFIKPLLKNFVDIGEYINEESTVIMGMVFEYRYIIALFLLLIIYALIHFMYLLSCKIQDMYEACNTEIKKIQEKNLNKKLANLQAIEQKHIQNYSVYISLNVQNNKINKITRINPEEQKEIINNLIFEKTGVKNRVFDQGFIYDYENFDDIDNVLKVLFKILKTEIPVDYQICVLIKENSDNTEKMRKLISLGLINKISTLSNTAYRYKFVENRRFGTSQLGLFQRGKDVFEAHEFVEII